MLKYDVRKALFIDDEEPNRFFFPKVLERAGIERVIAVNHPNAIEEKPGDVGLIVFDVNYDGMGDDTAFNYLDFFKSFGAPMIAITGNPGNIERLQALGIDNYDKTQLATKEEMAKVINKAYEQHRQN